MSCPPSLMIVGRFRHGPRSSSNGNLVVTERLIYVFRERKCPVFEGRTEIPLTDWLEEVKTSMRVHHFPLY